jgi:hypothetical protein
MGADHQGIRRAGGLTTARDGMMPTADAVGARYCAAKREGDASGSPGGATAGGDVSAETRR